MTKDWQASFITAKSHDGEIGTPAPYLRREFGVGDGLVRATLHATALGLIETYLNGSRVGDEVLAPGWNSYRHRLAVSSHDVTELLHDGENALGAIIGEGWAVGRLAWDRDNRQLWADRPAAFLQLELDYGDHVDVIASDASWRSGTGAVRANSLYDGEAHDARLEPVGWNRPGFDDSTWSDVEVVQWDRSTLIASPAPPIRRIEDLTVERVLTTPSGKTVVDFGQNIAGWVRIRLRGDAGTTITLRHCETLIAGEPDFETNRTAEATDRYTMRGGETESWEPSFTFHGFRYVEVAGWPGEITADSMTAVVVHSDMRRIGWFDSSNELLNRFHENVVWSMRGNFVGVPTDCPQRDERMGWTGDINAFASAATFLYDVAGVLGSWLEDVAVEQHEQDGIPPFTVPDVGVTPSTPTALWGDVTISLPSELYDAYGDVDVLARQYNSMVEFIDVVESRLDENGLWNHDFQFGDWLDPDAPPGNPSAGKADAYLVATAFLCRATAQLARIAEVLGHADDASRYRALNVRVRDAFRHEWITAAGLVANECATAYALAICFDLLDPAQAIRAGARLAALVQKAGYRISTGFAGTPFVTEALSRTGHLDTAYKLLLETKCPSFLYPVTMGATTIWERWDSIRPDGTLNSTGMTSLNHYALGAVASWLHRVVAGLTQLESGYRRIRVAPQPGGGLTHASAIHDTRFGRVRAAWRLDPESIIAVEVTVPVGVTAEVVLPNHPDGLTEQVGAGDHRWEYAFPDANARALTLDSTLGDLDAYPEVWDAVAASMEKNLGITDFAAAEAVLALTLREAMDRAGAASPKLGADLREAFGTVVDLSADD